MPIQHNNTILHNIHTILHSFIILSIQHNNPYSKGWNAMIFIHLVFDHPMQVQCLNIYK